MASWRFLFVLTTVLNICNPHHSPLLGYPFRIMFSNNGLFYPHNFRMFSILEKDNDVVPYKCIVSFLVSALPNKQFQHNYSTIHGFTIVFYKLFMSIFCIIPTFQGCWQKNIVSYCFEFGSWCWILSNEWCFWNPNWSSSIVTLPR